MLEFFYNIIVPLLIIDALLFLCLLALPLRLKAYGQLNDDPSMEGVIIANWAWGFLVLQINAKDELTVSVFGLSIYEGSFSALSSKLRNLRKKRSAKTGRRIEPGLFLAHRSACARLFDELLEKLQLQVFIKGSVGFDDPQYTAYIDPLLRLLKPQLLGRRAAFVNVDIQPNYVGGGADILAAGSLVFWPMQLIAAAVKMLWHAEVRLLLRDLMRKEEGSNEKRQEFA